MSTAFFFHEQFLKHNPGPSHPESPDRLQAILQGLKETGLWNQLLHRLPSNVKEDEILLCHTQQHLEFLRECSKRSRAIIDLDTQMSAGSLEAALLAAGAAVQAVDGILNGEFTNAFAAVRPPGHHATADHAMGFCLLNNIAIAARHAVRNRGLNRVLIMDWDVHHGNGTQHIFYDDPSVLYISMHKRNHYPGTGWERETGAGAATGTKFNIPVAGHDHRAYVSKFQDVVSECRAFRPEFVMISCGFDAHERDPLGNLGLKNETYARLTEILMDFAFECGHQRVFSILEGGYDHHALAFAGSAHIERLLNYKPQHAQKDQ